MRGMLPSQSLHHRGGNPVQHHKSVIGVIHIPSRYDEHRSTERQHLDHPFPAQTADLTIPAAGVDGKQRHLFVKASQSGCYDTG